MAKKQKTQSAEPAKVKKVTKVESVLTSTDVSELHRLRDLARKDKNWAVADALRDRIASLGHRVQDEKVCMISWNDGILSQACVV
jgi:cysteinyl-tRNA synthetase